MRLNGIGSRNKRGSDIIPLKVVGPNRILKIIEPTGAPLLEAIPAAITLIMVPACKKLVATELVIKTCVSALELTTVPGLVRLASP